MVTSHVRPVGHLWGGWKSRFQELAIHSLPFVPVPSSSFGLSFHCVLGRRLSSRASEWEEGELETEPFTDRRNLQP